MPACSPVPRLGLVLLLLLFGCDSVEPGGDGGADASVDGGSVVVCERAADCDDGVYCNGAEVCVPGDAAADARGCAAGASPCGADETCVEASSSCEPRSCEEPDEDDDGFDAVACGGDDCDDDAPGRYPGNAEVCDAVDDDCDPLTLGTTDADGDGAISDACCNGATCGGDCDDSRSDVNPTAVESCNGVDDDCNDAIDDEGALVLCPGGTCRSGRCDFSAWDRTWGPLESDRSASAFYVTEDSLGRVFVAGTASGTVDFGQGTSAGSAVQEVFVAALSPDGVVSWARRLDASGSLGVRGLHYSAGFLHALVTPGLGPVTVEGFALDGAGSGVLRLSAETGLVDRLSALPAQPSVAALDGDYLALVQPIDVGSPQDFGGGARAASTNGELALVVYRLDASWVWDRLLPAGGVFTASPLAVAVGTDGTAAIAVQETNGAAIDCGRGLGEPIRDASEVCAFDSAGAFRFSGQFGGADGTGFYVDVIRYTPSGALMMAGSGWLASLNEGERYGAAVVSLDGGTGDLRWVRAIGAPLVGDGPRFRSAAISASGIGLAGTFRGSVDFGSGFRVAPAEGQAFAMGLSDDGAYQYDEVYGTGESSGEGISLGRAGSTTVVGAFTGQANFGSGTRVSMGLGSAFVARRAQ